ncbi:MAG: protein kinase [Muribaculaceae bacterium]|nr:protein kinase [Muribaculaceae bacterium]
MESEFAYDSESAPTNEWQHIDGGGSGRFSFFKARIHGRLHFVKTLSEDAQYNLQSIAALKKEFEIGYNLDHPNIVHYLHFSENAIYEEYVDGKSIHQLIEEDSPLLVEKGFIEKVARQLLEAIDYIHAKGVLHLDLKPENVMITRVGYNVKIIDFGCAYISTYDNTQGFTLEYKAPEQNNGETNAYTDIYLIGRIIEDLASHAGVASRWRNFIAKATARNPAERFKSEKKAIAAIPSGRKVKWSIAALPMIVAFVAGAVILYEWKMQDKNTDAAIPEDQSTEQTIDTVKPAETFIDTARVVTPKPEMKIENTLPNPELKAAMPAPPQEDIRSDLSRKITDHIAADYRKNIKPLCDVDSLSNGEYVRLLSKMQEAIDRSLKFGETLAKQHPDQADYITTKVNEVINAQQTQIGSILVNKNILKGAM